MWKEVKKISKDSLWVPAYLRNRFDFPPLVAVAAGGRNEGLTVFRRCAAPEKKRVVRTEGSNSGELKGTGMSLFMRKKRGTKCQKNAKNDSLFEQKAEKTNKMPKKAKK